jgi:hypothetical protein
MWKDLMLPGLRLALTSIIATLAVVVLGFGQLVKLQVAQSQSAGLAPVESRFAGLAFAARADWTPQAAPARQVSLEALPPFAQPAGAQPNAQAPVTQAPVTQAPAPAAADVAAMPKAEDADHLPPPLETPSAETAPVVLASAAVWPPAVSEPAEAEPLGEFADIGDFADLGEIAEDSVPAVPTPTIGISETDAFGEADETPAAATPAISAQATAAAPMAASGTLARPIDDMVALAVAPATQAPAELASDLLPPLRPAAKEAAKTGDDVMEAPTPAETASPPQQRVTLPTPRPVLAALAGAVVPMPSRRPSAAVTPQHKAVVGPHHKAQPRPAKKKIVRAPARKPPPAARPPATPAASAPSNPFSALFGGSASEK